jgi:hypothetical protein
MGFLSGLFGGKSSTTTLEPMLTNEQKQAMSLLSQFGATGQLGDFQAGQQYDLSGFDFGGNSTIQSGLGLLGQNMGSGYLTDAQNALSGMVNAEFNPSDPSNGFAAFQRQLARSTQGDSDVLNREAAITGSRFGTQISKDKVDLAERQSDITASKLGDLWNQTQQNKLSAASGLANIDQVIQQKAKDAFTMGTMQQELQNQKAQASYDEWQRARNERLSSIDALTGVMNKNVDYGAKSITTKTPSIFSQFASNILGSAGNAIGAGIGGMVTGGIGNLFSSFGGSGTIGNTGKTQSQILGFNTAQYR